MLNYLAIRTPHVRGFFGVWCLVFGVPNIKYLAFGTPDPSVITAITIHVHQ